LRVTVALLLVFLRGGVVVVRKRLGTGPLVQIPRSCMQRYAAMMHRQLAARSTGRAALCSVHFWGHTNGSLTFKALQRFV
jgi:hypothetical protein